MLLAAGCVHKRAPPPARPAPIATEPEPEPPPEPGPPTKLTAAPAGPPVCQPPVFGDCPPGTKGRSVADVVEQQPAGSIVVDAVARRGDTACTRSVPAHCTTFLALTDPGAKPTHRLSIRGAVGKPGFSCSDGVDACCSLALDGTRYAVTGTLENKELVVASVCRIVE